MAVILAVYATRNVVDERRLQSNATVFATVHDDDDPNSAFSMGFAPEK